MRTFKKFPAKSICPICKTNENKECILATDMDNYDDNESCQQAMPVHADCIIALSQWHIIKSKNIIYSEYEDSK